MIKGYIILSGHAGQDAVMRNTHTGKVVTTFSLPLSAGRDKPTQWFRCEVWGQMAEHAATITKGQNVQVRGRLKVSEYQGKVELTVSVDEFSNVSGIYADRDSNAQYCQQSACAPDPVEEEEAPF